MLIVRNHSRRKAGDGRWEWGAVWKVSKDRTLTKLTGVDSELRKRRQLSFIVTGLKEPL